MREAPPVDPLQAGFFMRNTGMAERITFPPLTATTLHLSVLRVGVAFMRWSPALVPHLDDQTVYLVVDDFGRLGRAYRETVVEKNDLETAISDLLFGQYRDPVKVVAFNTFEGWSQDVSEDIAQELRR